RLPWGARALVRARAALAGAGRFSCRNQQLGQRRRTRGGNRRGRASVKPSPCLSSWSIRSRECPTRANMVPPAGWVRVISRITIYYTWRKNACPGLREKVNLDCQQSPKEKHRALVRCMNRPVWFQKVFHFGDQLGD